MHDFLKEITKNKDNNQYITGTVSSLNPLQVKIIPTDDAINVVATSNLMGVAVGSRLLLTRFQDQFIALCVISTPMISSIEIGLTSDQSVTTTTYTIIQFDTETVKVGSNLSFNGTNHSIVVGAGVKTIEVNATVWAMQYASGYSRIFVYKNSSNFGQHILPPRDGTGQYWASHTLSQIINVTEDDEITIRMNFGTANASNYVEGTQTRATHASAKVLEYDFDY